MITNKHIVVSRPANNTSAAPLNSHLANNHHKASVKHAASFRPEDIGTPQLESSTKSLTGIPTLRHSVCGMIPSAGPMAHTPTTQPMPSRPAPRPPVEDHVTDARTGNQDLDGHQPYRPPPPKNGFTGTSRHATSPWTQQPLPSIPSEAGHEMSTIETNCSRPLVADNKPRDRHRQKNQGRETSPKARPGLNPQAEGKQIEKYTAGHPLAEARTNSTVGKEGKTSKDKPSPPRRMDVKSLSPPHKDVKSPSLPHKDVKPPVTSKPKPIPAKPKINKKPSVSATKPRPNDKPVGLTVKVPNSKHDTDSIC